jgi:large subunit ribosomal protein L18
MKLRRQIKRKNRVKSQLKRNNSGRNRLCISRFNKSFYAQIIDDESGKTIVGISTLAKDFPGEKGKSNIETAKLLGKMLAEKAKEKGVEKLIFDRNGYLYHGKVKAFADSVRENGIEM